MCLSQNPLVYSVFVQPDQPLLPVGLGGGLDGHTYPVKVSGTRFDRRSLAADEDTMSGLWAQALNVYKQDTGIDFDLSASEELLISKGAIFDFIDRKQRDFQNIRRRSSAQHVRGKLLKVANIVESLSDTVGDVVASGAIEVHEQYEAAGFAFETIEYNLRVIGIVADCDMTPEIREASVGLLSHVMVVLGRITQLQKSGHIVEWLKTFGQSNSDVSSALSNLAKVATSHNHIVSALTLKTATRMMTVLAESITGTRHAQLDTQDVLAGIEDIVRKVTMNTLLERRAAYTCLWFLHGDMFMAMKGGTKKALLLHGKVPHHSSAAIQELRQNRTSLDTVERLVLSHFFKPKSGGQALSLRALLSSLACQLMLSHDACSSRLRKLWTKNACGVSQAPMAEIRSTLKEMLDLASDKRIVVVVDALEETLSGDEDHIVDYLKELHKRDNVALLISCRTAARPCDELAAFCDARVAMDQDVVNEDITTLVDSLLRPGGKLARISHHTDIREVLCCRADGSFRWITSLAQSLAGLTVPTSRYVQSHLNNVPDALVSLYQKGLNSIIPAFREDVVRLLKWVIHTAEPLSPAELQQLLLFRYANDSDMPVYDSSEALGQDAAVISLVGSTFLFVCDGVVRLAHSSVKDYLVSLPVESPFRVDEQPEFPLMARTGFAYISSEPVGECPDLGTQRPHHLTWTWVVYMSRADERQYPALEGDFLRRSVISVQTFVEGPSSPTVLVSLMSGAGVRVIP
ncbi:uncharacterized protein SCHCODRAFT_02672893 [Schizophyllum commune H4-8]|uniref:Nephrocystin 3-like N-terminal domain-containing protein n=1 Tax=Schizophyllum commune (strain H4-8 / FGSC 9210) TaxID=578458 RepID=D8QJ31_SCHCM|nr:uncharacterized protein SCHCODRAFT_02672893 [Schizophyllum commune H4-8]KAI5885808.1 hypothetical protein SCHCODRAFT_02672893 [Schizophyllum commune H4-8]